MWNAAPRAKHTSKCALVMWMEVVSKLRKIMVYTNTLDRRALK